VPKGPLHFLCHRRLLQPALTTATANRTVTTTASTRFTAASSVDRFSASRSVRRYSAKTSRTAHTSNHAATRMAPMKIHLGTVRACTNRRGDGPRGRYQNDGAPPSGGAPVPAAQASRLLAYVLSLTQRLRSAIATERQGSHQGLVRATRGLCSARRALLSPQEFSNLLAENESVRGW
jgi:hypothetical protein